MAKSDLNKCLNCQRPLVGRKDKKFCDAACRASHHNNNKPKHELDILGIQSVLRKNRKILSLLSPEGKSTVRKEVLDNMGYQYSYFTSLYKSKKMLYYLVYDYGFTPISESGIKKVLIIKKQDYMTSLGFELWKGN